MESTGGKEKTKLIEDLFAGKNWRSQADALIKINEFDKFFGDCNYS